MDKDAELAIERKRAYEYIKSVVCRITGAPLGISDAQLADILGGTIDLKDSLCLLRKGDANPTNRLVKAFKSFIGQTIPESEIDSYLVAPFKF